MTPEAPSPSIRFNKMRYGIAIFLASGFLPWGVNFRDYKEGLSLCGGESGQRPARWILCCGHTLSKREGEDWIAAGLTVEGTLDRFGRRTMIAGPGLQAWLTDCWEGLQARSWGNP